MIQQKKIFAFTKTYLIQLQDISLHNGTLLEGHCCRYMEAHHAFVLQLMGRGANYFCYHVPGHRSDPAYVHPHNVR